MCRHKCGKGMVSSGMSPPPEMDESLGASLHGCCHRRPGYKLIVGTWRWRHPWKGRPWSYQPLLAEASQQMSSDLNPEKLRVSLWVVFSTPLFRSLQIKDPFSCWIWRTPEGRVFFQGRDPPSPPPVFRSAASHLIFCLVVLRSVQPLRVLPTTRDGFLRIALPSTANRPCPYQRIWALVKLLAGK